MIVAIAVLIAVLVVLPRLRGMLHRPAPRTSARVGGRGGDEAERELLEAADRRAEELLRSVVGEEGWQAYRALGFLYAFGPSEGDGQPGYGYLIYPHRPMVSFDARSGRLLNELCVSFPELERERGGPAGGRLPGADDVLAKWMAIHGDELGLLAEANVWPPGRQIDPAQVRRDLVRLGEWTAMPSGEPAAS